MQILLINMGLRSRENNAVLPPLGIMSIAGYLRKTLNISPCLINQRLGNLSIEQMFQLIIEAHPDLLGLGGGTNSAIAMSQLTNMVRKGLPDTTIVIGGPHVSAAGAVSALESIPAHIAVPGEGERPMEMIVRTLQSGSKDFHGIPGLAWRNADGTICSNPGPVQVVEDMDSLPFFPYDMIDLRKYWGNESMSSFIHIPYAVLSTSRGCPYKCTYCHRIHGKNYRAQTPERIIAEIEYLIAQYGIRQIEFVDDVFNLHEERVKQFCNLLKQKKLNIRYSFPNGVRSDILTEELVDMLADTGMNYCSFALESGSPRIQKMCGKNLSIERFLMAVEWAATRKVFCRGFCIFGHPTETAEEIEETIQVACTSKLHACLFFTATPFPGTEMYRFALEHFSNRLESIHFETSDYHTINANLSEVSDAALKRYVRIAYRRFYISPKRLFRIALAVPHYRQLLLGGLHVAKRIALDNLGL